jgi:hypothetical protein
MHHRRKGDAMTALPKTSEPATRALQEAGYDSLESLSGADARELLKLHGFGPKAARLIDEALAEAGLEQLRR